jgi:hypothetical protein
LTTSLLSSFVMILVFYASAILTWILISRGWSLSFLTTLKAAGDSETYGKLEDIAEGLLVCLLIVSTVATIAAGILTAAVRKLWVRHRRITA